MHLAPWFIKSGHLIYKSHTIGSVYLRSHLQKVVFTDPIENESWKFQMTQYGCPVSRVYSNKGVGGGLEVE